MQGLLLNNKNKKGFDLFLILILAVALLFITISASYFVVIVDGDSMNSTLVDGDVVLVTKTSKVNRGDVIVFDTDHGKLIKRVIAVEGDEIYADKDGYVYLKKSGEEDFKMLEESYLQCKTFNLNLTVVEEGEIFVLGDNRTDSSDSRYFGAIEIECVNGKVTNNSINNKKITTFIFGWIFNVSEFLGR